MRQWRFAGFSAEFIDDLPAHERADAGVLVRIAGHTVADHGVDADETRAGRNLHLTLHFTGPTQNVGETTLPSARDGGLIHDAARRTDDMVLRHLAELRDARRREV